VGSGYPSAFGAEVTWLIIWGLAATVALLLWSLARGEKQAIRTVNELLLRGYPVDVRAFENLCDEKQDHFLRMRLPKAQYLLNRKRRKNLQIEYLKQIAHNCALLVELANANKREGKCQAEAERLAEAAFSCRMNALKSILLIRLGFLTQTTSAEILSQYGTAKSKLTFFCLAGFPEQTSRATNTV
jgi:hypothetical protein